MTKVVFYVRISIGLRDDMIYGGIMTFSSMTMLGYVLRTIFCITFPFVMVFTVKRKFDGRIYPFIIGMTAVNLLVLPRMLLRSFFVPVTGEFGTRLFISVLIGALCEETARFLMMKYMMKNNDTIMDAVCYGIGHHAMELIPSVYYPVNAISAGIKLSSVGIDGMTAGMTAEESAQLVTELENYMSESFFESIGAIIGCIPGAAMQISWSVLVFTAVYRENYRKFFFIAIALHMIANIFLTGIITSFIGAAVMCYIAYRAAKSSRLPISHLYY